MTDQSLATLIRSLDGSPTFYLYVVVPTTSFSRIRGAGAGESDALIIANQTQEIGMNEAQVKVE
jgi:hypothetical protein